MVTSDTPTLNASTRQSIWMSASRGSGTDSVPPLRSACVPDIRQHDAEAARDRREQQALDQQLADEVMPAGAERGRGC